MTEMFLNKLCRHLDYCSERLAPLALFSDATTLQEKHWIAKEMRKYAFNTESDISQTCDNFLPLLNSGSQLKDLIGSNSMVLINRIKIEPTFIYTHPRQWAQNSNYNTIKTMLQHIKVVNESAE